MLTPTDLSTRLQNEWLGQMPDSSFESADMFAGAVSGWFASAMAAAFPCSTAAARRMSLTSQAASALQAGAAPASGMMLATAVATYYSGQLFGSGAASFPTAVSAGIAQITAAFLDVNLQKPTRADMIAQGCLVMAVSTIVIFPAPLPPAPIL